MTRSATKSSSGFLGERIRTARLDAEVTIAALARELGVDPRTVAGWQAGRSKPSYERLTQLAKLLNKPPSFFLDEETS